MYTTTNSICKQLKCLCDVYFIFIVNIKLAKLLKRYGRKILMSYEGLYKKNAKNKEKID